MDADETVWDTTMIRGRNVSQLDKSALHAGIYRIQLLYDIEKNTCCVWYCQSVAGSMEQTTTVGIGGLKWGKRRFEKLFQVATSLSWENRRSLPGQNGWIFIQSPSEYEKTTSNSVQQPIPTTAQGVLRFLFSERKREIYQRLINLFSGPRLKKPQYQIRRHTLQTAIAILERILRILAEGTGSNLKANEKESSKKTEFGLEFLWLFYLDLLRVDQIDQTSNSDQYGPWRIDSTSLGFGCITMDSVLRELQDLRFILNLNTINRIIKQDSQLMDEALMQRAFRTLGLEKMKLGIHSLLSTFEMAALIISIVQVHSPEYSALTEYLNGSIGSTHRLKYMVHSIFRIRRPGEEERFDREEARDRRLLWHGTSSDNIIGILNQGLRAHLFNKSKNAMFGAGIYFADMSSKSARYCASSGPAFLLLCEVELGSSHIIRTSSDRDVAEEKTTVIAHGQLQHRQLRSAQYIHHKLKDVLMPDIQAGKTYAQEHKLFYNEYIVYDPCQIRQRYLFHMDIY
ncbi:hypothetical protein N7462_003478 [Penicillium macrosclerotiorum]|uniref:uncharacterized protein n=1 Tax=Penicillium macrosclerotiorum TaxID=303699 RepID=UPI00254861FB|nr:uncharacterized protein N7462_003478 [Penicillium macrosclerotiorum]KAJ5689086.1 hypothetical protein N7462_003478 [Penicillium macrosclerotiorum]